MLINSKNNKGFSLVEALVGIGLLSIVTVVALNSRDFFRKSTDSLSTLNTLDNRMSEIVQSINGSISEQIVSFPDAATDTELEAKIKSKLQDLPMGWSLNSDMPVTQCVNCPGRYGYLVTPVPNYPGLFNVTIRFTHRDWMRASSADGGNHPIGDDPPSDNDGSKVYRFLVTR